jgi:SAM-dependent methyltransferase
MTKSFKEYEHEGWNSKASQYERFTLPITRQGFEPILASFGDLRGKKLLDVCTGPGHLAGEAASHGASVDAIDFSEAMIREAKALKRTSANALHMSAARGVSLILILSDIKGDICRLNLKFAQPVSIARGSIRPRVDKTTCGSAPFQSARLPRYDALS